MCSDPHCLSSNVLQSLSHGKLGSMVANKLICGCLTLGQTAPGTTPNDYIKNGFNFMLLVTMVVF